VVRSRTVRPYRQPSYSGRPGGRLCGGARHRAAIAAAIILGLATGGCSYKLGGFFGKDDPEQTSALKPIAAPAPALALPADADLALTKAAVHDLLSRGAQDTSVPWENPRTGARGTVTPIAAAYTQDGFTCRDFLASYVREGVESWLQGEACRIHKGRWEVKSIRPLKKA
jgi:hypothetical protein